MLCFDDDVLEELEEILIMADLGPSTAAKLTASLAKSKFNKEVSDEEVREAFAKMANGNDNIAVAVRSSATAEWLMTAAAEQHNSILKSCDMG